MSSCEIRTRTLRQEDVIDIVSAFEKLGWDKPQSLYERYLEEQENGERIIWVAFQDRRFAGYVTLKWSSSYLPFKQQNIPEIMDLNVLPQYRKHGIGNKLLDLAEEQVGKKGDCIGLGVGLYADYGSAQRIYVKRGYVPDGMGVTYDYQSVPPGEMVRLDDDLVLWFTKKLS